MYIIFVCFIRMQHISESNTTIMSMVFFNTADNYIMLAKTHFFFLNRLYGEFGYFCFLTQANIVVTVILAVPLAVARLL